MDPGLTVTTARTRVLRYHEPLWATTEAGETDPSAVDIHRASLADGPALGEPFDGKADGYSNVPMMP